MGPVRLPLAFQIALQDLQTNSKIAALLPYFVYVVSGVSEQAGPGRTFGGRRRPSSALRMQAPGPPPVPLSHPLPPTGEVCEPRFGAAAPALASGPEPGSEPTPLPGALCPLSGGQCPLLRPGAPGCLHQPPE